MSKPIAAYIRRGFTVSRRASLSYERNELPMSHWIEHLRVEKTILKKLLIYAGYHHTGLYARRTKFYRLPRLDDEREFKRFYKVFHSVPAGKKKFVDYMSKHLQEEIRSPSLSNECLPTSPAKNNYIKFADFLS